MPNSIQSSYKLKYRLIIFILSIVYCINYKIFYISLICKNWLIVFFFSIFLLVVQREFDKYLLFAVHTENAVQ